jgi:hypothetical protein
MAQSISIPGLGNILPTHWYYNTESGQLSQGNNLLNLGNNLVGGAGWHELNIPGSATAAQAAAEAKKEFPKGKTPTAQGAAAAVKQAATNGISDAAKAAASAAAAAAKAAFSNVFSITGISGTNLAVRLVKVIAGGLILIVGLAKITGADKAAGGVAAKAVKVAPFL